MLKSSDAQRMKTFEAKLPDQQMQEVMDTIHEMMVDHLTYLQTVKDLTELTFRDPDAKKQLEDRGVTQEILAKQNYEEVKKVKEESSKLLRGLIEDIKSELLISAKEQNEQEKREFKMDERVKKEMEDASKYAQQQTTDLEKKLAQALDKEARYLDMETLTISTHLD